VHERLGRQTVEELVAAYQDGATTKELTRRYSIGQGTVLRLLGEHGVAMRRQGMPPACLDEAARLYGEGWSLQRLADRYGCSAKTVGTTLKHHGVRMREPWERA